MKHLVQLSIVYLALSVAVIGGSAEAESPASESGPAGTAIQFKLVKFDISPPLRDIEVPEDAEQPLKISREHKTPEGLNTLPEGWNGKTGTRFSPHVLQKASGTRAAIPAPTVNIEGLGKGISGYSLGGVPPDTTGGVGPNYYIQWVNTAYAFFDKTGAMVNLPGNDWRNGNTIWSGFGGKCQTTNDGDPIVIYDQLAGRWVMTQFGLSASGTGPHSQCVAVSTTGDPLGTWARTEYEWPSNYLNDYPKMGVWPDGYYLAVNQFSCNNSWSCSWHGGAVAVFDRENLLQGIAPRAPQYFDLGSIYGSLLPVDIDGDIEPPEGSPGYFIAIKGGVSHFLRIWETSIDWDTPANSTCGTASNDPSSSVAVTSFSNTNGIDQPGTTEDLDSLSPRLMFRAPYRNFGDHESIVLTHTVGNPGGMRWYEIRDPGGSPVLYQEGTYVPDADERWMGAVSMDSSGNIAMGYSVSGAVISPSIRATGRLADDPLGTMTFSELEIATGSGHQNPSGDQNRWGDYSTMSIDPSDDCTFWYTQEYITGIGSFLWRTRIAAFKFDECITDSIFADGFESSDIGAWSVATP
ncbi:MAG: hypothetical protein DRJ65_19750 [Acidobacteria bacterium]|nr:MAG: hypothetical protein DRJ65_19750 [Acidobacteriota bacterium]